MPTYNPWSVVTVPFPFTDKLHQKKRPALVLSHPSFQEKTHHATLCMITSAKNSAWQDDILIRDLEQAGLPAPSVVRLKIFTLDIALILSSLGDLADNERADVQRALRTNLAV